MPFVYTEMGQYVSVVLAALFEMRGVNTKLQTIAHIEKMGWLELQSEDYKSYPTHQYEAIWHTKIAFARQWCVEHQGGLMSLLPDRDSWQISPIGSEKLIAVREKFRNETYNFGQQHLWSSIFRIWMRPDYKPSPLDDNEFV
jgi:hypothetical protein